MYSILDDFHYKVLESDINKEIVFYDYKMPENEIFNYVHELLNTDIVQFLNWQNRNYTSIKISYNDMVQFSSFSDVLRISSEMIKNSDKGIRWEEAGRILLNDGKDRKKGALVKYGENHLKTSEYLGYIFSLNNTYFVSCLGYVNEKLSSEEKTKLLTRLIIRTNLFRIIFMFQKNGNVDLRKLFDMLSDSTYKRRLSNVRKVFDVLLKSDEYDFSEILNKIIY